MGLFQKSVIAKYLKFQSNDVVSAKWKQYTSHFLNPKVQDEIRELKEEQYQGEFLEDLFVKILGYTKPASSSETKFNLTTEYKNVKDAKKADGAIIIENKVVAVIELKGCDTIDLGKVEAQAFNYKNNQPECIYVITSNFEKLRLYIDNAIEHIEFNLFSLTEEDFKLLYLCLSFDNISHNIAKKIKDESLSEEDVITKKLYKDYSVFKRELHQNLVTLNPNYDPLLLFKKSQKLLDRFLFLFFGEDRNLLPPNSVRLILSDWKDLQERDVVIPLYDRFKKYFEYLNTGFKGKRYDVFAYNGGLFKPDDVLDTIKIDDELLFKHTTKLSEYDFASEVDVNILGHIFENSLNELDEIKAELEGTVIDKSKTKRKKDGVFYTPKYITKYIVENTVGKLCVEKKAELQIIEEDYSSDKKRTKATKQPLLEKLETYRKWLLQLTICDPACGSGAFLNQALDFLINEHKYIDELQAKLFGDALILSDIENSILENNLYGVDLNEESVEIAKLSLWLRTAQPNRKLNDLNNNIKCGNSLIDDPQIAGDKAFNWFLEFPKVFPHYRKPKENIPFEPEPGDRDYLDELQEPLYSYKTGSKGFGKYGFDVIIGNPPYVQIQSSKILSDSLQNAGFKTFERTSDLYCLFYELGNKILKQNGILGFITSNKWMRANYGKSLRKYLLENTNPYLLLDLGAGIFESATVDSNILFLIKAKYIIENGFNAIDLMKEKNVSDLSSFNNKIVIINPTKDEIWTVSNSLELSIKKKIELLGKPLKYWNIKINYGIKTGYNEAFVINRETRTRLIHEDPRCTEILKPILRGRDIQRYYPEYADLWLINTHNGYDNIPRVDVSDFPSIKKHLDEYWMQIEKRYDKGLTPYNLRNCAYVNDFFKDKIIYQEMVQKGEFFIDNQNYFCVDTGRIIVGNNLKYLVCLLNSKLFFFSIKNYYGGGGLGTVGIRMKHTFFENFPAVLPNNEELFIEKADQMLSLNKELQELSQKFQRTIKRKFEIENLSTKLQDWYKLSYPEFIKELAKKKVKLSLSQEAEWEDYFNQESKKALELKATIDATDKEIDGMVYKLYDLTDEEIAIVEQS
jgi:hypothetical protein